MVAAIVPAAGASRRMRYPKPLVELGGETLVVRLCSTLLEHFEPVVLVVGWCGAAARRQAPKEVVVVSAQAWWRGSQAHSVQAGLAVVPPGPVLIHPIDVPVPSPELLRALASAEGPLVPSWRGRRGHPVLLSTSQADALRREVPEEGLRPLLSRAPVLSVDDPSVVENLNHPRALVRWLRTGSLAAPPQGEPPRTTR